jgi:hypothetical protein
MKNTIHSAILKRGQVFTTACLGHFYALVSLEINDLRNEKNYSGGRIRQVGLVQEGVLNLMDIENTCKA